MYCLMRTGAILSPETCEMLFQMAREMYRDGKTSLGISADDCEGRLTTAGRTTCLGGLAGPLFEAMLDHEGGTTMVRFIVSSSDLPKDGKYGWFITTPDGVTRPLEEVYC